MVILSPAERSHKAHVYRSIGYFVLKQLAALRHRGAFSTVSQTFSAWCATCVRSGDQKLVDRPRTLFCVSLVFCTHELQTYESQDVMMLIDRRASALTRRSAGIPAIITGIVAAYPDSAFFHDAVLDLQSIADAPVKVGPDSGFSRLPQVHALNGLKDIFTDSRFGPITERHMADTLDISASCLDSHL